MGAPLPSKMRCSAGRCLLQFYRDIHCERVSGNLDLNDVGEFKPLLGQVGQHRCPCFLLVHLKSFLLARSHNKTVWRYVDDALADAIGIAG